MSAIVRGKLTRGELALWDGRNSTYTRLNASGGTITQRTIGDDVDVLQIFGSGSEYTSATMLAAKNFVSSAECTLRFSPGTWVVDTSITFPSTCNIRVPAGCVFAISSGITLTFSGNFYNESPTYSSGSGTLVANIHGPYITAAESAASVTPVNFAYPEYDLRRRGITDFTGATAYDAQIAQALLVASNSLGSGFIWHPGLGAIGHSGKITVPNKVTILGFDRNRCEFLYSGTGIGWQNVNGPNSSGYGQVNFRGVKLTSNNAANTDAAIDIRAGGFAYYSVRDCWILGKWKFGVVLDGAEVVGVNENIIDINGAQAGAIGVWIVNGADRAVGQTVGFTNVVNILGNQISGASGIGIVDDGGNAHTIMGNNTNQFPQPARFSGVTGLKLGGTSFELTGAGSANSNVTFESKTLAGVPVGPVTGFDIGACGFYGNVSSGSLLAFNGALFNISAITRANPCVVTFSTGGSLNPFFTQQFVYFASIVGMVELNGKAGQITALGGSSGAWTVTLALDTSSGYTAYASGGTGCMMHSGGIVKGNNFGSQTGRTGAIDVTFLANSECGANFDAGISTSFTHYVGAHADTNGNILRPPQNGSIPSLGTGVIGTQVGDTRLAQVFNSPLILKRIAVTYSASMALDLLSKSGQCFDVTATNNTAFTFAVSNVNDGAWYGVTVRNTSGGALGAITPDPSMKLVGGAWPVIGNGKQQTVWFLADNGGVMHEQYRTSGDVTN